MAKSSKPQLKQSAPPGNHQDMYCCNGPGTHSSQPNLAATNPSQQQFEPTTASPLPKRQRMAGVS